MTFEEWQETRVFEEDNDFITYKGGLEIEELDIGYYLTIGNYQKHSISLVELERELYDWATKEGYFDD